MFTWLSLDALRRGGAVRRRHADDTPVRPGWRTLPLTARLYVALVVAAGAMSLVASVPRTYPQPVLFAVLLVTACLTSTWKVNLPIAVTNGSTLSVSYAANLMSLLLLGPQHAVIIAAVGAWTQCTYRAKHLD